MLQKVIQVLPIRPLNLVLNYQCNEEVEIGQIVSIPFKSGEIVGVVLSKKEEDKFQNLKLIREVFPYVLPKMSMEFIKWVAKYNLIPLGSAFKFSVSKNFCNKKIQPIPFTIQPQLFKLSVEQKTAIEKINNPDLTSKVFLLEGVTGSGKTEIYFHLLIENFNKGFQGLVLLPEISLTKQFLERFKHAFGIMPYIWHSKITPVQKRKIWQSVLENKPLIVVGARSALFLPFENLGLIVVDEEHDSSYKQHEPPFYHARDMAIVRAHMSNIPIVLGSATPSIETFYAVLQKKYNHIVLKSRFQSIELPVIRLIDMKETKGWISEELKQAIRDTLYEKKQLLIYINRRGYAPICLCHNCGYKIECQSCLHPLTFHQKFSYLLCHRCGYKKKPSLVCPKCHIENPWRFLGPGIERVEEVIQKMFPNVRIISLSSDKKFDIKTILNFEVDLIIGTQILAKGHHFPLLKRVVVLDGDSGLMGSDFRGMEKTFQLLQQVSGRAGRENEQGEVFIQTNYATHPIFECLVHNNQKKFYDIEIQNRKKVNSPPFSRYIAIILSCSNEKKLEEFAMTLKASIPFGKDIKVLGPASAPFSKLRGKFRWRFLFISKKVFTKEINHWLSNIKIPSSITLRVDVDPYDFI